MKKAGEVWKVTGRKGPLTIKLLGDVDEKKDDFFNAEIVSGKVQFISADNNFEQRFSGLGTPGHVQSFRTTLTTFITKEEAKRAT